MLVVAADGSGDFTRVQDALDQIPADNKTRVEIRIKSGIYKEKLTIDKPFVSLVGEDAETTILTFNDYAKKRHHGGGNYGTHRSQSVFVGCDDFTAENITFENSAGRGEIVGQALAAYVEGDRIVFRNCRFIGHQDTLFTGPLPLVQKDHTPFDAPTADALRVQGRQYYDRCFIKGDVDFIFGSAAAVFDQCTIYSNNRFSEINKPFIHQNPKVNGWITAASTIEDSTYGYVFVGCRLESENAPKHTVFLGRPWRNFAKVAFIGCWMGEHIKPEGWDNWNKPESEATTYFCEYGSTGPGGDMSERVTWSHTLTAEESAQYEPVRILAGKDGWNPVAGNQ